MKELLALEDIRGGYGKETVIDGITFSVREGEYIGIIGPNGTGKSTLLKCIEGTTPVMSGKVRLKGREIRPGDDRALRKGIASVMNDMEYPQPYRVYNYILMGRFPFLRFPYMYRKEDYSLADRAMEETGVVPLKERLITELSSGEKQLVSITRALAQEGELLLLDEPLAHLDLYHAGMVLKVLRNLKERKKTVLTVIHDINAAALLCGRIIGIREGKVLFDGPPGSVITGETMKDLFGVASKIIRHPVYGTPAVFGRYD